MIDITSARKIHIVGIGGAGMSAIAIVLVQQGYQISGSDLKASVAFERLRAHGVQLFLGHESKNVEGADLVAISSAIPMSNPEVRWAIENGVDVVTRSDLLPSVISSKSVIGVAGTHGKTTTTSMLSLALMRAGLNPSFLIGGELNEIGTNALWDDGDQIVIEADESDGTFLHLGCKSVIVTNVEPDHLDYYGEYENLKSAFRQFVSSADGPKVVCMDSPDAAELTNVKGVVSYGFHPSASYTISDLEVSDSNTSFAVTNSQLGSVNVTLAVPGRHNVLNATAVIAMANELGVGMDSVLSALSLFAGVARRYQYRGKYNGATLVDDYAHLPGEIDVVLETARSQDFNRVVAVFQPHRYSRTASLYREFAAALTKADLVIVTDVYAAGEIPIPGVTGELISNAIRDSDADIEVYYAAHRKKLGDLLGSILQGGDICITLGAGDLTTLFGEILEVNSY